MLQNTSKLILYCFLAVLTLNIITFYAVLTYASFGDPTSFLNRIMILGLIQWVWISAGLALSIKGFIRKEPIDLRYRLSTIGLFGFLLFSVVSIFVV